MGRKTGEVTVYGRISDTAEDRDDLNHALWERFIADIERLADRPEYAEIDVEVHDRGTY